MKNLIIKAMCTVGIAISSLSSNELVLLDTSGSMHGIRGENAKKMVKVLLDKGINVLGFSDKIEHINTIADIKYNHGSNLGDALEYIYNNEPKLTYLNVITDGDVGDAYKTLKYGSYLKDQKQVKICSVSVDTGVIPSQLEQISELAVQTSDILQARVLCQKVRKKALNEVFQEIDENAYNLF